jgi:hypothetical protein
MGVSASARIAKFALTGVLISVPVVAAAAPAGAQRIADSPAAPSPTPADISDLAATFAPLKTTSHDVIMKTRDSTLKGSVDPARHAASLVATAGELELDEVVDSGQVWLKMDLGDVANKQLGISPDKWMKLDSTKLVNDNNLPVRADGSDPIDMPGILAGVTTVSRVDATHLAGTLDLTKVTGHNAPDPDAVKRSGDAAKSVAYAATTDNQGRITVFRVDTTSFDPGLTVAIGYSNYGAPSAITKPANAIPAPDSVYSVFN